MHVEIGLQSETTENSYQFLPLRFDGLSGVECWELSNISADVAVAILRVNIHPEDGKYSVFRGYTNGQSECFRTKCEDNIGCKWEEVTKKFLNVFWKC